jgi:hypothetical protein
MPHNLAWHDWEMRTRVQRAHREVEQIRKARMAGDPAREGKDRLPEWILAKLQSLAGSVRAPAAQSAQGA